MDQNLTNGPIEADSPYFGADEPEDDNDEVDFGDEVDPAAAVEREEGEAAKPAADAGEDDSTPDADEPDDDAEGEEAPEEESDGEADSEEEEAGEISAADEDEEAPKPEPEPDPTPTDQRIPKQRFDEVNERRKLAEKKLAELEAAQQAAQQAETGNFDFDAKEQEYMELVVDGEFARASEVRKEIRAAERAEAQAAMAQQANMAREQTKVDLAFQDTVDALQNQYPAFDKDSAQFDETLVDEALMLHDGFLAQDMDPIAAIKKAVDYVARANGLNAAAEEAAPDPVPEVKTPSKKQTQKKVEAKTKQPQNLPKGERVEQSVDMESMSEEEFDRRTSLGRFGAPFFMRQRRTAPDRSQALHAFSAVIDCGPTFHFAIFERIACFSEALNKRAFVPSDVTAP
jgi:hypothetical protein